MELDQQIHKMNLEDDIPVPVTAEPVSIDVELSDYMKKCLAVVAANEGFKNFTLQEQKGSNVGDGFVGILFKVVIQEVDSDKRLNVILKAPPANLVRREEFGTLDLFRREVFMYNELLPSFVAFQLEKNISKSRGFFDFPKCYYAEYDEDLKDSTIIMEDLHERDCKMWDKFVPINYEHAKMVMESLGRFHAISFAMKAQRPEIFDKYKLLEDIMSNNETSEGVEAYMLSCVDRAINSLSDMETTKKNKVLKLRSGFMQTMKELASPENAEPFAVVGHGDCWTNNFMFQYRRNRPEAIVFLDFQVVRYCSPVLDLMYFIFNCTDSNLRAKHYDELLGLYHKSLKDLLEEMGGDVMTQFPFTAFLRQLKTFGKFGLTMSTLLLPMLSVRNEDLPDMDTLTESIGDSFKNMTADEMKNLMPVNEDVYKIRMRGVINDSVKYGYL